MEDYKKILIVGSSGAGKSTYASKLSKEMGIPVFYYDQLRWLPNWDMRPREEVLKELENITKKDSYIFEGTYGSKLKTIADDCDVIMVLKVPTIVCTYRVLKRTLISFLEGRKGGRADLPEGCNERLGLGYLRFIKYTITFNKKLKEMYKELESHKDKIKIIKP